MIRTYQGAGRLSNTAYRRKTRSRHKTSSCPGVRFPSPYIISVPPLPPEFARITVSLDENTLERGLQAARKTLFYTVNPPHRPAPSPYRGTGRPAPSPVFAA